MMQRTDFTKAFFTFKMYTVLPHTRQRNFLYAHKESTVFPAQIFTKLKNA
jgi:hypothetical protein